MRIAIDPDCLPNNVNTLRATVAAQGTELAAARAGLLEQRYEIEALCARVAVALRVAFGRLSEKLCDQLEQLELTLADLDERIAETEPKDVGAVIDPIAVDPIKPTRRPLPAALPRDRSRWLQSSECAASAIDSCICLFRSC